MSSLDEVRTFCKCPAQWLSCGLSEVWNVCCCQPVVVETSRPPLND